MIPNKPKAHLLLAGLFCALLFWGCKKSEPEEASFLKCKIDGVERIYSKLSIQYTQANSNFNSPESVEIIAENGPGNRFHIWCLPDNRSGLTYEKLNNVMMYIANGGQIIGTSDGSVGFTEIRRDINRVPSSLRGTFSAVMRDEVDKTFQVTEGVFYVKTE